VREYVVVLVVVVVRVVDEVDPALHLLQQLFRQQQKTSWSVSGPSSKAAERWSVVADLVR